MMNIQEFVIKQVPMALAVACGVIGLGAVDSSAAAPTVAAVKHVNAEQAQKLLADKNVLVLDLRTPEEFAGGRIAGATNLNFLAPGFEPQLAALDPGKTYLVYCASGHRSTQALPSFKKLPFQSLYHLDGGFKSWQKAGLPIAR
jgi:rhodanese-related sulfurtransferase